MPFYCYTFSTNNNKLEKNNCLFIFAENHFFNGVNIVNNFSSMITVFIVGILNLYSMKEIKSVIVGMGAIIWGAYLHYR